MSTDKVPQRKTTRNTLVVQVGFTHLCCTASPGSWAVWAAEAWEGLTSGLERVLKGSEEGPGEVGIGSELVTS